MGSLFDANVYFPHWHDLMKCMFRRTISFIFVFILSLNSGCIHTAPIEEKAVEKDATDRRKVAGRASDTLQVETYVYSGQKLPLSEFFARLQNGEFTTAFKKFDLNYKPSTARNAALEELINQGFVPTYVKVTNVSDRRQKLSLGQFAIFNGSQATKAILVEDLPRQFRHFNSAALAADIYNTTVYEVGAILVLFATASIAPNASGEIGRILIPPDEFINSVHKTTKINYRDFLLQDTELEPNESSAGLVFFRRLDADLPAENYRIDFHGDQITK